MVKETDVIKSIVAWIHCIGGRVARVQTGSIMTEKSFIKMADNGTPDLIACIHGKFIGIEVKKDQKEVEKRYKQKDDRSKGQFRQGLMIGKAGGMFCVVASASTLKEYLVKEGILEK